ncbi:MAG: 2Fe-2S iron-sulfur cluster binding domain-containing protein [Myxococcales bacterium FL481]|nr:MAG: 2Fe-2S iron-sulfur cluster binding domain-containing protein [Myxococcales bacterium FL481]
MPKVTFQGGPDPAITVEAEPGQTLLEIAEEHHVKMGSACGGVCACSSCHCWIRSGEASLEEATEREEDRMDMGFDVRPYSRLGCQVRVAQADLVVELTEESVTTWYNEHPEHRPG